MESKKEELNVLPFNVFYIIIFAIIIVIDIVVIVLLMTVWAHLEGIAFFWSLPFFTILYFMFLFSPIIKLGFGILEIVRFIKFLKSGIKEKEKAMDITRGFRGTRIFRVYYIVLMLGFVIWMNIRVFIAWAPSASFPGQSTFVSFYFRFEILLYFHMIPLIIGPSLIKFSTDPSDKKKLTMLIIKSIIWIVIIVIIFNIEFPIYLVLEG